MNPSLAKYWHPTKNGDLTPDNVYYRHTQKVWWMCDKGHEWSRSPVEAAESKGCPYCTGYRVSKLTSLAALRPDLAKEWNHRCNGYLKPHSVKIKSRRKVWWVCEKGHEWQMDVATRVSGIGNCPYCMGKRACYENAVSTLYPAVADQWHPGKNGDLTPDRVSFQSSKKAWWICDKGHEWQAVIRTRTILGSGCPVCSCRAASSEYNLLTEYPEIAKEWDVRNNEKGPEQYRPYSNKTVGWTCPTCGKSWEAQIIKRTRENAKCPFCFPKRRRGDLRRRDDIFFKNPLHSEI
jgi:hypothetical protein